MICFKFCAEVTVALAREGQMMWAKLEPWQLLQLQRLAKLDPERVESLLNTLFRQYPGLYGDLAIMAVDQEQITVVECAESLGVSEELVEQKRTAWRRSQLATSETAVIVQAGHHPTAKLAEGHVAVWEVIREYRKVGSLEALRDSFPAVSEVELASAIRYAQEHLAEIDAQIEAYERMLALKRAEYPFAS